MNKKLNNKENEKQVKIDISEVGEDATKYGEFISTYFAWISLPKQKDRVSELENMTKNKEKIEKIK